MSLTCEIGSDLGPEMQFESRMKRKEEEKKQQKQQQSNSQGLGEPVAPHEKMDITEERLSLDFVNAVSALGHCDHPEMPAE